MISDLCLVLIAFYSASQPRKNFATLLGNAAWARGGINSHAKALDDLKPKDLK